MKRVRLIDRGSASIGAFMLPQVPSAGELILVDAVPYRVGNDHQNLSSGGEVFEVVVPVTRCEPNPVRQLWSAEPTQEQTERVAQLLAAGAQ